MRRLIYVVNQRIPTEKAYGIQIAKMCESFALHNAKLQIYANAANNKIDVELVIPWRISKIKQDIFNYYGVKKNFRVKRIFAPDFYLPGSLDKIAFTIKNFISGLVLSIYALFSKSDIIYSRDELPLYFLSFFKKNIFFEAHKFSKSRNFFYRRFKKLGLKIIAISQGLKNEFIKIGFRPENILVAYDGVDLNQFDIKISKEEARKKIGLANDKKIILYTGHLFDWKGIDVLLEAARNFQFSPASPELSRGRAIFNFKTILFVFVGGTEGDVKKINLIVQNYALKNVLILGHKSYSLIPYYLKAADILVLPNSGKELISKLYTSPLKLFEYMASKRPIVASSLPSIREILSEENSVLVDPDNPQALAEGIKRALSDSDLAKKISNQAYQNVQNYTWQKRAEKIMKYIEKTSN